MLEAPPRPIHSGLQARSELARRDPRRSSVGLQSGLARPGQGHTVHTATGTARMQGRVTKEPRKDQS
ncbi:hypothetical protein KC338_g294 [Hortaea werneckii]|nr:hypothetical protein KC338_g294 [Hortaea werneckii]